MKMEEGIALVALIIAVVILVIIGVLFCEYVLPLFMGV